MRGAGPAESQDTVRAHVAVGKEDRVEVGALVGDREREPDPPVGRHEALEPDQRGQGHESIGLIAGPLLELTEVRAPAAEREAEVRHAGGAQIQVQVPRRPRRAHSARQAQLVHPDLATERTTPLVPDAERELPHVGQIGAPPAVTDHDGVRRVRTPDGHRRVARDAGCPVEDLFRPPAQLLPLPELHHQLGQPVRGAHPHGAGGPPQTGAEEIEVLGVAPDLKVEVAGPVRPEVSRPRHHPEARLAVAQEIPRPLGEALIDLRPLPRLQLL